MDNHHKLILGDILSNAPKNNWDSQLIEFVSTHGIFSYEDCANEIEQGIKNRCLKEDIDGVKNILMLAAHLCASAQHKVQNVRGPMEWALYYSGVKNNADLIYYILDGGLSQDVSKQCPKTSLLTDPWASSFKPQKNLLAPAASQANLLVFDVLHDFYKKRDLSIDYGKVIAKAIRSKDQQFIHNIEKTLGVDYQNMPVDFFVNLFKDFSIRNHQTACVAFMSDFISRFQVALQTQKGAKKYEFVSNFLAQTDSCMNAPQFSQLCSEITILPQAYMNMKMSDKENITKKDFYKFANCLFRAPETSMIFISSFIMDAEVKLSKVKLVRTELVNLMTSTQDYSSLETINKITSTIEAKDLSHPAMLAAFNIIKELDESMEHKKPSGAPRP